MGLLEAGMKIIPSGASPVLYILIKKAQSMKILKQTIKTNKK